MSAWLRGEAAPGTNVELPGSIGCGGGGAAGGVGGVAVRASRRPPAASSLSSCHNSTGRRERGGVEVERPSVEFARNGTYARVRMPGGGTGQPGKRAAISEFTHRSRRNLLCQVNSIDREALRAERVALTTLTYPGQFVEPRAAKKHLKAWLARLQRAFPGVAAFWKLEPQGRGAPHFHLLTFLEPGQDVTEFHRWVAENWCDVVGSEDPNHLRWHLGEIGNKPCVEPIRTWNGVASYASKYLGKAVSGVGWDKPGRWWGKHNVDLLPVHIVTRELTRSQAVKLRRAIVGYIEHQPTARYLLTDRDSGRKQQERLWLRPVQLERFVERFGSIFHLRPYHRLVKFKRAGIGAFIPSATMERLILYATAGDDPPASH